MICSAYRNREQERYDALMSEPWCYRPWEIRQLIGPQIDRLFAANARFAARFNAETGSDGVPSSSSSGSSDLASGIKVKLEKGITPTFNEMWLFVYSQMPGMTLAIAKEQYERQSREFEEQKKRGGKGG